MAANTTKKIAKFNPLAANNGFSADYVMTNTLSNN